MKKILAACAVSFVAFSMFASGTASVYIDGRVAVAQDGDLPTGLFAKASSYLPGDNISITNPESGQSEELLVLGSLDSAGDAVLVLSKEAAEQLGVSPTTTLQVKLARRNGSYDKSVTGTALLSHSLIAATDTSSNVPNTSTNKGASDVLESILETIPEEDVISTTAEEASSPLEDEIIEESIPNEEVATLEENVAEDKEEVSAETEPVAEEGVDKDYLAYETIDEGDDTLEDVATETPVESEGEEVSSKTEETEKTTEALLAAKPKDKNAEAYNADLSALDYYEPGQPLKKIADSNDEDIEAEKVSTEIEEPLETSIAEGKQEIIPEEEVSNVGVGEEIGAIGSSVDDFVATSNDDMYGEEVSALEPEIVEIIEESEEIADVPSKEEEIAEVPAEVPTEEIFEEPVEPAIVPPTEEDLSKLEEDTKDDRTEEIAKAEEEDSDMPIMLIPGVSVEDTTPKEDSSSAEEEEVSPAIVLVPLDGHDSSTSDTDSKASGEATRYQRVILIPADPKAPPVTSKPKDKEASASGPSASSSSVSKEPSTLPATEPPARSTSSAEVSSVPPEAESAKTSSVAVNNPKDDLITKRTVNETQLQKGKYYVQVATLSDRDGLNKMLSKYSNYPMLAVPLSSGKGYKVMVGPMSVDEYGVVLERFKAFGYKDSFVKVIK